MGGSFFPLFMRRQRKGGPCSCSTFSFLFFGWVLVRRGGVLGGGVGIARIGFVWFRGIQIGDLGMDNDLAQISD